MQAHLYHFRNQFAPKEPKSQNDFNQKCDYQSIRPKNGLENIWSLQFHQQTHLYFWGGKKLKSFRKGGKKIIFFVLGWEKARVGKSKRWEKAV